MTGTYAEVWVPPRMISETVKKVDRLAVNINHRTNPVLLHRPVNRDEPQRFGPILGGAQEPPQLGVRGLEVYSG
jgi:hypothetical protein